MEGKDHVVVLSEYLTGVLCSYGELPPTSVEFKRLAVPDEFNRFAVEIQRFMTDLLREAAKLPDSPGRVECTTSEIAALRQKFIPFDRSYKLARQLLQIAVPVSTFRRKRQHQLHELVQFYLTRFEVFGRYERLRSWLYRRTKKYEEWSSEYYARPEVKKAQREKRPSKEAERERKRADYWRKKGFAAPPPRLPKAPQPQGLLDDEEQIDQLAVLQ
jgi:hypothetical protein